MAFATLERDILRIEGLSLAPGAALDAGTALQTVRLTTIDEDIGPQGPLAITFDPYRLNTGETASLRIDGVEVLGEVPSFLVVTVETQGGTLRALAFTAGGDTYLIPVAGFDAASAVETTAASTVANFATSGLQPSTYGLIPENANTFTGQVFVENYFGASFFGGEALSLQVFDADTIRDNADSDGEEFGIIGDNGILLRTGDAFEALVNVTFADGSTLAGVAALVTSVAGSYGSFTRYSILDEAALAAAGQSADTVTQVTAINQTTLGLDWQDLGLDLTTAGDGGPFTSDPEPFQFVDISGTRRADNLLGTDARDLIQGFGRNDTMDGGAGADAFVFGEETRDGRRDTDLILNYEAGIDATYFADGATVRSVREIDGGVRIVFDGDRDSVEVYGDGLTVFNLGLFSGDFNFIA